MNRAHFFVLALVVVTAASAGVVRNVSDSKTVSFDWPMPIGDGSEVLVATSSNQFAGGGNPNHAFQIAAFDPTTGNGALVTSLSSASLVHVRHNLSVSDDGQWLAFISNGDLLPGQNGNRSPELFVIKRDGSMLAQLTDDPTPNAGSVSRIAMAGSGNRIAFVSSSNLLGTNPNLNQQVYLVDIDGSNLTQMTQTTRGVIGHMWVSDDGTRIAFSHNGDLTGGNPELNQEVFTIAMGDVLPRQVTSSTVGESGSANISGDGSTIVFASTANSPVGGTSLAQSEIYSADWTSATVSQVTNTGGGNQARQPWPTNNGSQIFYSEGSNFTSFEVYKINTSGTGRTQLTTLGLLAEHPVVSGDGSRFAFWAEEGLYAAAGDGSNLVELIERSTPTLGTGDITADGQWLSFFGRVDLLGGNPDLSYEMFVQSLDGTQYIQVTDGVDGPSGVYSMLIADGSRAYFESTRDYAGQNPEGKGEIFGMDVDGGNPVQLTECDVLPSTGYSVNANVSDDNSVVVFPSLCDLTGGNADHSVEMFRVDTDGSNLAQLTSSPSGISGYFPRIDATGTWTVFSGNADIGGGNNADLSFEIWRIKTDGTNLEQLTSSTTGSSLYPDISDDGSRIVFLSDADLVGQNPEGNTEVFLYEPATTTTTQLTQTADGDNEFLAISGNGAYVYFRSDYQYLEPDPDRGRYEMYRIHIDSSTIERAGGFGTEPRGTWWPVSDYTGDRVLFASFGEETLSSPDTYWDVYLSDYAAPNPLMPSPGPAPTELNWKPEPGMLRYDVIRGNVANLQHSGGTVDLGPVVCLKDDSGDTTTKGFEDPDDPAPGQAFFYLYRGQMGMLAGGGTYGAGTGDLERIAGAGDCAIAQLTTDCGNGVREFGETCDGADLGGESCAGLGFDGGALACDVTCDGFDVSLCATCGDDVCQAFAGEDCLSCPFDCNGQQGGNPSNRYCCGDGDGENPVPCSDPRCTASGNTCVD